MEANQLKEAIEQPQVVTFWGAEHTITPRLAREVFGDGRKLIALIPLNNRPNYYVVRVDSKMEFGAGLTDEEHDVMEHMMTSIEEEYGRADDCEEDCAHNGEEGCRESRYFPYADFSVGHAWGNLQWPEGCNHDHP